MFAQYFSYDLLPQRESSSADLLLPSQIAVTFSPLLIRLQGQPLHTHTHIVHKYTFAHTHALIASKYSS